MSSFDCLLKVVEGCPNLENLYFHNIDGFQVLRRSDIEAIATLHLLKTLFINCVIEKGALDGLARCKRLKSLALRGAPFMSELPSIFFSIGRNLIRLVLGKVNVDTDEMIIKYCPGLVVLEIELDEVELKEIKQKLRRELKKVRKMKVNGESV
jgi:hypothetical protein